MPSAVGVLNGGIQHLHDEALLSLGQTLDALDLLLQLRGPAAPFGGRLLGAEQLFDGDAEGRRALHWHCFVAELVGPGTIWVRKRAYRGKVSYE